MEAYKFGFGMNTPPAFKFDPTDADLVAHYLLPRALGLHNPHAHAIIEGVDPGSVPPWDLLGNNRDHAFFFGPPTDPGRKNRTIQGAGVWMGQKGYEDTITLLRPGGGEVDIRYKRYHLSFGLGKGGPCTGYVMHEYTILSPPLAGTVLSRIKFRKNAKNVAPVPGQPGPSHQCGAAVPEQPGPSHQYGAAVPEQPGPSHQYGAEFPEQPGPSHQYGAAFPEQPGPSHQYGAAFPEQPGPSHQYGATFPEQPGPSHQYGAAANGEGFAGAQDGALCDSNGGGYSCNPLDYALPVSDYDGSYYASIPDQPGPSYNYNGGFTDQQTDAFLGGAYYDPSNYVPPECGNEYSNYYGEYQQWQYQQDPSSSYQAGDAAVPCAGDEGFIGEEQAGGNSDKGSVIGTGTTAHSTISLCGDDHDVKCEQNDAGDPEN